MAKKTSRTTQQADFEAGYPLALPFKVVEKSNPLAVHALCDTRGRAEYWIAVSAPRYCKLGYFADKTLTSDSFTIVG